VASTILVYYSASYFLSNFNIQKQTKHIIYNSVIHKNLFSKETVLINRFSKEKASSAITRNGIGLDYLHNDFG